MLVSFVIFLALVVPALGKKKKNDDMLVQYPIIVKFCMFWWCMFVFAAMSVYIIDHLITKRFGPARVDWIVEHTFRGGSDREDYWAQFVDLSKWSTTRHPVLLSADVRMVKCDAPLPSTEEGEEARTKLTPLQPGVMKPNLGFILRYKSDAGKRAGIFYCTRKCLELEKPKNGIWRYTTQTVEVGAGYAFEPGSERTELQMWPPADDGSIRCEMSCQASVASRVFRWWSGLAPATKAGAEDFLVAIGTEVERAKKSD